MTSQILAFSGEEAFNGGMEDNRLRHGLDRILESLISLEVSKGHLRWKVSELARKAKVSRPLIYYHLGRSKQEIMERSALMAAERFFGLTEDRLEMLEQGRAVESLMLSRRLFLRAPAFGAFYLRWRMERSPLQSKLIGIEERYQRRLKTLFPHLSKKKILALHGIFHGVVTAPFLDDEAVKEILKAVSKIK